MRSTIRNVVDMLARLARACVRHRWIVIGTWLALLIGINAIAGAVGPDYRTDFTLPDSESKVVQDLLEANDPNRAGFISQIVAKADQGVDDPEVQATLEQIYDYSASQDGITVTSPYDNPHQVSADGTINFAQLDVADRGFEEVIALGEEIVEYADTLPPVEGLQIEYGGDIFSEFELPESEIYGLLAAVIILILAFGSVLAMGLPIGTALFGLGIGSALVSLGSNVISMPDFTTAMVAMIGIGVGIDYALFIVTRYREGLQLGLDVEDSVVEAMDTSGRAVLFAGATVIISLLGLCLMGLDFVQGVAIASSLGVLMMVLGSLTLLPALLGWVGRRIDNTTRAALIAVSVVVVATFVGVATGQAPIFFAGLFGAIIFFALSFAIKPLRKLVPHRAERPTAGAVLVPLEPVHPAPAVAERARRGRPCSCCSRCRCSGSGSDSVTTATIPRTRPCAGRTTCWPTGSGPAPTARSSSPSRATRSPIRQQLEAFVADDPGDRERQLRRSDTDQRPAGAAHRVSRQRTAGRRDRRPW